MLQDKKVAVIKSCSPSIHITLSNSCEFFEIEGVVQHKPFL
jgi:hypothetical protein